VSSLAQAFWLAAPVVIAGILHMVLVRRNALARLAVPLDGGRTLGGKPIFGPNKTWRGVVFMTFAPALLGAAQGALLGLWAERADVAPCDLGRFGLLLHLEGPLAQLVGYAALNLVLGFGYALGELPNSFLKRRVGIEAGKTSSRFFFVLDQADSVIAALLLGKLFFPIEWATILVGIVSLTLLHLALNAALYFARVRRNL
jgi:CDP-diglyceride synthetase